MSNETVEKIYEGQPPAAPMPEAPIESGAPSAMPMPAGMPAAEAVYAESVSAEGAPTEDVIPMEDYPHGRGGMNAVPMAEGAAGETNSSRQGESIGERPPAMEMPSA